MINTKKKNINKWFLFPSDSDIKNFKGYGTRDDITYMRGFVVAGQNIKFTDSHTPIPREGSELIGDKLTGKAVKRAWVFEKRNGTQIEMKTYGTEVWVRIDGVQTDFELLQGGYTDDLDFCYGVISESGNAYSQVLFCNGTDNWKKWRGEYASYLSDNSSDEITVSGSTNLSDLGFASSGTIIINGVEITYTGLSAKTFTGCSAVPSSPTVGDIIMGSPTDMTGSGVVVSSVAMVHDGRLMARSETKQSVSNYSKLDDPDDWTAGSLDGDGGAKEIEQGGPITAYGRDEKTAYIFKKRQIKTLEFVSNSDRIDVPKWGTLKPADDKSSTVGAIGQKSTFHSPNGVIFVTEDKSMLHLTRKENIDYPQLIDISDAIKPTFRLGVHDEGAGIVYKNKVYYAYKKDKDSTTNDVVIAYDLIRGTWDTPYIGWNVADWTIVDGALHWHSSLNPNSYKVIDSRTDNDFALTSSMRTWSEHFGYPEAQKTVGYLLVEIYLQSNSNITLDVLYDEKGFAGKESFTLNATNDNDNKVDKTEINSFGLSPFGTKRFGSNDDIFGLKKYRYIIELKKNIEFFNIAIQLTSKVKGDRYELVRFGYFLTDLYQLNPLRYLK